MTNLFQYGPVAFLSVSVWFNVSEGKEYKDLLASKCQPIFFKLFSLDDFQTLGSINQRKELKMQIKTEIFLVLP